MTDDRRVYGIDLGTTFSCIAHVDSATGRPVILRNTTGDLTTPSVVLFEDDDSRVVGKEAKNVALLDPDRVVSWVKRQMGEPNWRFTFRDRDYPPEEISSYIVRKVAEDAAIVESTTVQDVVITCPAYFGISERDATAKAGEIAGLNVLEVINEPTAAAIAHGLRDPNDEVVLVYDLGGGTFDITMIGFQDERLTVIATGGDRRLGGHDWDEQIVQYLADAWQEETGAPDDPLESRMTLQDLWQRAEEAKHALSVRTETQVTVSHAGQVVGVSLTREKFEELTRNLLERTIQYTRDVLTTAKELGHPQFDQILLVGGSTRMPQVRERLVQEFGVEPKVHDPDQAVAKGAAVYAQKLAIDRYIEQERFSGEGEPETPPDPDQIGPEFGLRPPDAKRLIDMKVDNVASHSFGIVVVDPSGDERTEYISNLVQAQDQLPATRVGEYATLEDGQAKVELQTMECTRRGEHAELHEGEEIGTATLNMIPGLPAGSPIEVTFVLRQDGRLEVTGKDLAAGGDTVRAEFTTNRSLSDQEVEEAKPRVRGIRVS